MLLDRLYPLPHVYVIMLIIISRSNSHVERLTLELGLSDWQVASTALTEAAINPCEYYYNYNSESSPGAVDPHDITVW